MIYQAKGLSFMVPLISRRLVRICDRCFIVLLLLTVMALYRLSIDVRYFQENAIVENWQLVYLGLAVVLYIFMGIKVAGVERLKFYGLAIFLFTGFVRETDPRGTMLEPYLGGSYRHHYEFIIVGLFWLAWLLAARKSLLRICEVMLKWLFTLPGVLTVTGIGLFVVGAVAERHPLWWGASISEILEESFELLAYYCMLLSAYISARKMQLP